MRAEAQHRLDVVSEIPVVDLDRWSRSPADRDALAREVRDICHHVGFLAVVNHGIPSRFLVSMFDMMARLFALPEPQKRLIDKHRSRHFRGWEAVGAERTNNRPDMREQVDLWSEHPARAADVEPPYLRLLGPNQWLTDDIAPGFESLSREWFDRAGALASTLLSVMSRGLGLSDGYINDLFGHETMSLTKLIRYPATPPGAAGVNAHHDTGFLTVLAPGPTPGLEIQNAAGHWFPAQHVDGSLIINLGEMLQGMTGKYFVATAHRVITTEERYSMAYFHGPSLDMRNELLPLDRSYFTAVAASPRHSGAGFMARKFETEAGIGDMASAYKPSVYGEQLWNYFERSYPTIMRRHYGRAAEASRPTVGASDNGAAT
ncbi:MAG: 2-oxoglutarate and iron-dependent oxygenase domain-containing protein [Myxococcota bacterium]